MRAVSVTRPGGPESLSLTDVPQPTVGPGEVLIRVVAAGVNRADILQREGHYPPPPGITDTLGLEVSGHIADVGAGVTGWEPGDACLALLAGGGYAEYIVAPAGQVVLPPDGVDLVAAAGLMEVAATVTSNLSRAHLVEGEVFLVHGGAGGIGSFAIQYAKSLGVTVLTTAGSEEKLDYCRSIGADEAISYRGDWAGGVRAHVGQRGVDVILDNIGARYLGDHVDLLGIGGRLVVIGLQGGAKGTLDLSRLQPKRASITATSLRSRPVEEKTEICRTVVNTVWPLIADGRIALRHTAYAIEDVAEAHRQLDSGDHIGKAVLVL